MIFEPDVKDIPEAFRDIASSWYMWQRVYLRARHRRPGDRERAPKKWETEAEIVWGARPPQMVDDSGVFPLNESNQF